MAFICRIYKNAWYHAKNMMQLLVRLATCRHETDRHAVSVPPCGTQNGLIVTIAGPVPSAQRERGAAHRFNVLGIWNIRQPANVPVKVAKRHRQPRP